MQRQGRLEELLRKEVLQKSESDELQELLRTADPSQLETLMREIFAEDVSSPFAPDETVSQQILEKIHRSIPEFSANPPVRNFMPWLYRLAAACFIGLMLAGAYYVYGPQKEPLLAKNQRKTRHNKDDVSPGTDRAMLILADGSKVELDSSYNGSLANQGNTQISKSGKSIRYISSGRTNRELLFNTITTPRGGQYKVQLPDGTNVWLNAASSIRFPTSFEEKTRHVEITGEAYLEVAKDKTKPFIATVNGSEIEVLGTHFNVTAYGDDGIIKTTLLEGSVFFSKGASNALLKPGEQSRLKLNGELQVDEVDVNTVVAWKNGYFDFQGSDIETVARQLSRWYDVEVIHEKKINELFYARIPRNTKISDVFRALELTGKVKFEMQGNKIIVR